MNKMTTVSTTYARIAIVLLAFNFVLTGYVISTLANLQTPASEVAHEHAQKMGLEDSGEVLKPLKTEE